VISFVIPAHNEELLLGRTLRSIHAAAGAVGEPYEIVVTDDASTDGTAEVATEHGARVVSIARRQIAASRNAGGRAAQGEELVFVDADTVVNAEVVRAAVRALRRGAVGGGCAVRLDGPLPLYARLLMPLVVRAFALARLAGGCFLFCTRRAFDTVGGFNEGMFGAEEVAMSRALGRQGRFVVLRESVVTSGRKLRAYSGWEVLATLTRLAARGPGAVRRREGMEFWYGPRREDPWPDGR
jgi:glycosyltransferase involved in cell wall biosynthesis